MKRLFTLIILLGLVIGAVTGCEKQDSGGAAASTNAAPSTPPTNAPAK